MNRHVKGIGSLLLLAVTFVLMVEVPALYAWDLWRAGNTLGALLLLGLSGASVAMFAHAWRVSRVDHRDEDGGRYRLDIVGRRVAIVEDDDDEIGGAS